MTSDSTPPSGSPARSDARTPADPSAPSASGEPAASDSVASDSVARSTPSWGPPVDQSILLYQVPSDPAAYYQARWGQQTGSEQAAGMPPPSRSWLRDGLVALATGVVIALLGFPLAWLWHAISPVLTVKASGGAFYYTDIYSSQWAAWESLYVVISIATGIAVAILSWILLRRFRGPLMAIALALGGGTAGWIIWRVGRAIGRADFDYALRHPVNGEVIKVPIDLRIQRNGLWHGVVPWIGGNLTYLAIAAVATYCVIAGFTIRGDLDAAKSRTSPPSSSAPSSGVSTPAESTPAASSGAASSPSESSPSESPSAEPPPATET